MKIRVNYVSNSSSSSYLIICKSFEEFDKFKGFNGYETFKEDFSKSTEEGALDWVAAEIYSLLYCSFRHYFEQNEDTRSWYAKAIRDNAVFDLTHFTIDDKCTKTREAQAKLAIECQTGDVAKVSNILKSSDYKELAKEILDNIESRGYIVRSLTYADDSELGSYMEHCFMPFLAHNPEAEKQQVFTRSEH